MMTALHYGIWASAAQEDMLHIILTPLLLWPRIHTSLIILYIIATLCYTWFIYNSNLKMTYRLGMVAMPHALWAIALDAGISTAATGTSSTAAAASAIESNWYAVPNVQDVNAEDVQKLCPGYSIAHVKETDSGLTADLNLAGSACNVYGNDIENLFLTVEYQDSDRVHVKILPKYIGKENATWFSLPEELVPKTISSGGSKSGSALEFRYEEKPTFVWSVVRKANNETLFSTAGSVLVYADQFFEFQSSLPRDYNLYGLGETIREFRLGNNLTRTLWNADVADQIDSNLYGSHPIYLDTRYYDSENSSTPISIVTNNGSWDTSKEYTTRTHGAFMRNAHGQEILLRNETLTWRSLGGAIDLTFFSGPSAPDVVASYQKSTIGLPALQQYWTFGLHLCRWGYKNVTQVEDVVRRMRDAGIPLETMWTDIDYMEEYRNFAISPTNYPLDRFQAFVNNLHSHNQHYIPIIDAAVYRPNNGSEDKYIPYKRAAALGDVFLKRPEGDEYIGKVWPGYTVFPDFVGATLGNASANAWWNDEVKRFHADIPFDGLWIDMSEASSFCEGSCGTGKIGVNSTCNIPGTGDQSTAKRGLERRDATEFLPTDINPVWRHTKPMPGQRNMENPPYALNHFYGHIARKGIAPSAQHHVKNGATQYDFHNLFGYQLLNATHSALLETQPNKRPFIIGRSTFAGTGRQAGHWGGDNFSLWEYLALTISQGLSFSIFGIPMFGTDACGFLYDSNEQLCNRWMQLNAFIPFYRNHNGQDSISQEPYIWASVADATKTAIKARYSLLPYIYTLFQHAHTTGSTVMRALTWEFPSEPWFATADRQFLLGPSVLVVPVVDENATSVSAIFPNTTWYDFWSQTEFATNGRGKETTVDAPLGHIPVFIRGGSILPIQQPANTTVASRGNPWEVVVALANGQATGDLFVDDGVSVEQEATLSVVFEAKDGKVTATPEGDYKDSNALAEVSVLGVEKVESVKFNGVDVASEQWSFDEGKKLLKVQLANATSEGAWCCKEWTLEYA